MTYRLHIAPGTCARVPLIALEEADLFTRIEGRTMIDGLLTTL